MQFYRGEIPQEQVLATLAALAGQGASPAELDVARQALNDEVWISEVYQAQRRLIETPLGLMVHLSIKRRDRGPIRDWRDMQAIKNALVGPECEGVELYPAESRLVDTANQYHIWALATPGTRFPFGFSSRLVSGEDDIPDLPGAVQRPRP